MQRCLLHPGLIYVYLGFEKEKKMLVEELTKTIEKVAGQHFHLPGGNFKLFEPDTYTTPEK